MNKTLVTILIVVLWVNINCSEAYSRVATNGNISNKTNADGTTHRPREGVSVSRLLMPQPPTPSTTTTEPPTTTTLEPETGRAVNSRPFRLPFMASAAQRRTQTRPPPQRLTPIRAPSRYGGQSVARKQPQIVYPVYTPSNHRPAQQWPANHSRRIEAQGPVAMDRFSPAEAYSAGIYKAKQKKKQQQSGYNYPKPAASFPRPQAPAPAPAPAAPSFPSAPTFSAPPAPVFRPAPAPAPPAPVYKPAPAPAPAPPAAAPPAPAPMPQNSYIPPSDKDLYSFPPNINSPYLPPPDAPPKEISPVSSYLPPAAGPADSDFKFPGPVNPMFLPMEKPAPAPSSDSDSDSNDSNGDDGGGMDDQTAPPDSSQDHDHDHFHPHDHDHDHFHDLYHDDHFHAHDHDHYNFHGHDHHGEVIYDHPPPGYFDQGAATPAPAPAPTEPPAPPAPMDAMDQGGMPMADDDMGGAPAPFPDAYKYNGLYGVDANPELIYDHDPHHDHDFHYHHHHVEPTTTTTEEPPPEPRVKKYSYYYLGRKLWYIPLYFTVWFTFYVAALILRSIARHKVEIPEHYQRRKRDIAHRDTVRKVDKMTVFVMTQIEDFAQKYLQ